ncbi:hypothetical protein [Zavarzinella formosa]|uniref:hypothetical protein n=1 Tax=Zavarzinella formosa TaxID=360055 RepID=UPI0002E4FCDD|nr:hypothetical protein [Zavarzinella formosa]
MTSPLDPAMLRETYRREGLSLLQYIRQATPYAGRADRPLAERVRKMADDEGQLMEEMAGQLSEARVVVPSLGGFPSVYTNFNYFDVRKLLPYLIADHTRLIDILRQEKPELVGLRAAELLKRKEIHLAEMNLLAG